MLAHSVSYSPTKNTNKQGFKFIENSTHVEIWKNSDEQDFLSLGIEAFLYLTVGGLCLLSLFIFWIWGFNLIVSSV